MIGNNDGNYFVSTITKETKKKKYTANTPTMNMGNDGYKTI